MKAVGVIGLGLLGSALAERLLKHGWAVSGFDTNPDRRQALNDAGGTPVESVFELSDLDTLLLSLPTSEVVADVIDALKSQWRPGQIIVDTTTGRPQDVEAVAGSLASQRVEYLDACVGGSSEQARNGDITIMCGGSAKAFNAAAPLFNDLSSRTFHLGPVGSGSRMKLVVNLVLGLNRAVLAEGLGLAESLGLDAATALEVLKAGPAWSRVMDVKGDKMLECEFSPQARLAQHLKDVRLILESGRAAEAQLPLSELHEGLLQSLVDAGLGDFDNSSVIQAFRPEKKR